MIAYYVLSSGSCGNCYAFTDGKTTVLIDMGLTFTALSKRCELYNIPLETIKACFVTHLHPDHSKGLGVLARKLDCPIFISQMGITAETKVMGKLSIPEHDLCPFEFGSSIKVGAFLLKPFRTKHDSVGSCGYEILHPEKKFFLLTDCGAWNDEMVQKMSGKDVFFIESNYSEKLLMEGDYPLPLKNRIRGEYGHMSNDDAINLIKKAGIVDKIVYFIHLSDSNNEVELVEKNAKTQLGEDFHFQVCERGKSYEGGVF